MSFSELRLTLPGDARVSLLAYAIWSAGVTPWSWAMQCGPDFLDRFTPEQYAGWQAWQIQQERERAHEYRAALDREVARAERILAQQGRVLANGDAVWEDELDDGEPLGNEIAFLHPDLEAGLKSLAEPLPASITGLVHKPVLRDAALDPDADGRQEPQP